jgi:hypothetical protein
VNCANIKCLKDIMKATKKQILAMLILTTFLTIFLVIKIALR